jgi:hypothetical protein
LQILESKVKTFCQFINESKDNDFDAIKVGDHVRVSGTKYKVEDRTDYVLHLKGEKVSIKVNKSQYLQKDGKKL